MAKPTINNNKKKEVNKGKITIKAIQISSLSLVTDDPVVIGRLAIASSLLAIAAGLSDSKDTERLIRTASKLSTIK